MSTPCHIVFLPHANLQYSQLPPSRRAWVVRECYEKLFDLVAAKDCAIGFEASGFTLDLMAEQCPDVMRKLADLVRAGRVEPVGSPYIHVMLGNLPPELGVETLKKGRHAWERHTGVAPALGWNPECSWSADIPAMFREAGFTRLVMDGDSLLHSFDDVRQATGLRYDVAGHSNKDKLLRLDRYLDDRPEYVQLLTRPLETDEGLTLICRSDTMANPMLWYLMGATEGVREKPVTREEIRSLLATWKTRVEATGSFIVPFAEDAEYIGSSAYFYVKQFGHARFFEPEPDSVSRFETLLDLAVETGFSPVTPSTAIQAASAIPTDRHRALERGIAWHGGTSLAWANTPYARVLDPTCRMIYDGIQAVAAAVGRTTATLEGDLRAALESVTAAYVSDARWPPAPTSPGRFNVRESLADLRAANGHMAAAMKAADLATRRDLYSPELMDTQIASIEAELMSWTYFGESTSSSKATG